ncbi:DELLA protein RGL1-like [Neltuma alba]|uniref:DELLA protein RGL1-like n=1 Tax=Neltuma alba TaxID=207710 RepID=UPI0010A3B64E|nr:DELLA protein RGL1-like [Prosopis alba]
MEDVNIWLSFSMNENLNHDFAIRRFCPARIEQERGDQSQDHQEAPPTAPDETELSSSDAATISTPCLASSDVDEFVDSFINTDQYDDNEYANEDDQEPQENDHHNQTYDHIMMNNEDEVDPFYMMNEEAYGYVPITMQEEEMEKEGSFGAEEMSLGMDKGLDLVHMLLACAEAVSCKDTEQANLLLRKIWTLASPWGDSLQRVAYCFAEGLKCRLSFLPHNVSANNTVKNGTTINAPSVTREMKLEAFHLLYQTTPCIAFGYMAANEAICQASQGKNSLHIIDLGMEHALQWSSLIRALASRPEGAPRLRITGLINYDDDELKLQSSMSLLVEEASSFGIALEFHIIPEPATPSLLTKEKLNLREGEALFINSILRLHKYVKESRGYLKAILQSIKKLNPAALTVVEQDSNHNGPFFLGRFLESLHYYSAIFDSLEASMPRNSQPRSKIERLYFAEEIRNIVAYEGLNRMERHESADRWRRQLGRAGFQVMALKCTSQARMMLSVYDCDGYTLSSEKGCLLLGWRGRSIMMASAWRVAAL